MFNVRPQKDEKGKKHYLLMHTGMRKMKGEVFNVASGDHRSILSIAQDIARMMGRSESNIQFTGDRPGQVFRHTGDIEKMRRFFHWEPEVSWKRGLDKTIKWYQESRFWWDKQLWMRTVPIIAKSGKRELH